MILDGKKLKEKKLNILKEETSKLDKKLTLCVIQVGEDTASEIYVNQKKKMADFVGFAFKHIKLKNDVSEDYLLSIIDKENKDDKTTGIIVQMPLPSHINETKIQNAIDYHKDIDGLSDINTGRLVHSRKALISCTPKGILELLKEYNIKIESKHVVIVGRSNLVGKPLVNLFLNENATVTICHSKTKNLKDYTITADILISAVGKKNLITKDMVKQNAVVIDVGITRENNKLYGDVDFDNVFNKASYITPVPGGVGPMTVTELGYNVLEAYQLRSDANE